MNKSRLLLLMVLILGIVALVLGVTFIQRQIAAAPAGTSTPLPPGSVPIYVDGEFMGAFTANFLSRLPTAQFTDVYEEKPQQGWMLSQVILQVVPQGDLDPQAVVIVSSSSRDKSAQITWAEVSAPANFVMFDLSNRGTLKLVSVLPQLDGRNEWVQDVDRIEIQTP